MISDRHGGPLSPVVLNVKTQKETLSFYGKDLEKLTHMEELAERINWLENQAFRKPLVHIIDREGDSIGLMRALGHKNWLLRANDGNYGDDGTGKKKIKELAKTLSFTHEREVNYKGKVAQQLIAETKINITRAASQKRKGTNGKRLPAVKGMPVKARLVVSRIVDAQGKELATWYLLSNFLEMSAATLALWYYWRWSIESYFKLIKSAGMQLEAWQQKTGIAIARRLLVASMACVWVWRISHAKGAEAGELRRVLIRLSGRQMKWKKEYTHTALCAGLWTLLSMQDMLDNYGIDKIRSLLAVAFGENKLM
jgi:hypothetical protein